MPALRRAVADVLKRLRSIPEGSVVPIDLENVILTGSCHATLFGPVLEKIVAREFPGRFVIGRDPTGENEWDADAALSKLSERRGVKLVCVWEVSNVVRLVGAVDEQVRATYEFLQRRCSEAGEGATARELAQETGSSIQAASNRLARLGDLGLAYTGEREPVEGGGVQYRYVPVM
jgi:DNA-binding transcriptional ArsR family regulator